MEMLRIIVFSMIITAIVGQVHQLSAAELQQCTTDLACSIDYSKTLQSQLDNATHYMELELALLRHQTNNILVPVQTELGQLQQNHSHEMSVLNLAVTRLDIALSENK